jgi:hypothetical protein
MHARTDTRPHRRTPTTVATRLTAHMLMSTHTVNTHCQPHTANRTLPTAHLYTHYLPTRTLPTTCALPATPGACRPPSDLHTTNHTHTGTSLVQVGHYPPLTTLPTPYHPPLTPTPPPFLRLTWGNGAHSDPVVPDLLKHNVSKGVEAHLRGEIGCDASCWGLLGVA